MKPAIIRFKRVRFFFSLTEKERACLIFEVMDVVNLAEVLSPEAVRINEQGLFNRCVLLRR